jgi:hypothetical protein
MASSGASTPSPPARGRSAPDRGELVEALESHGDLVDGRRGMSTAMASAFLVQ